MMARTQEAEIDALFRALEDESVNTFVESWLRPDQHATVITVGGISLLHAMCWKLTSVATHDEARRRMLDACEQMLRCGADPNATIHHRSVLLDSCDACRSWNPVVADLVRLLVSHGADVRGTRTMTPLFVICAHLRSAPHHTDMAMALCDVLLDAGANLYDGCPMRLRTPLVMSLSLAVKSSPADLRFVRFLLERGSDVNSLTGGYTPVDWLSTLPLKDPTTERRLVRLLRDHGGLSRWELQEELMRKLSLLEQHARWPRDLTPHVRTFLLLS